MCPGLPLIPPPLSPLLNLFLGLFLEASGMAVLVECGLEVYTAPPPPWVMAESFGLEQVFEGREEPSALSRRIVLKKNPFFPVMAWEGRILSDSLSLVMVVRVIQNLSGVPLAPPVLGSGTFKVSHTWGFRLMSPLCTFMSKKPAILI